MTMNTWLIFPPKTARDACQHDMVANFGTALTAWFPDELDQTQRNHPAPQWLRTGALRKDSAWPFSSTGHLLENSL